MLNDMQKQQQLIQQQNALLLNVIMGSSSNMPISNMEQLQSIASLAECATSGRWISRRNLRISDSSHGMMEEPSSHRSIATLDTSAEDLRPSSRPAGDEQLHHTVTSTYCSNAVNTLVLYNTTLNSRINVNINYEQVLSACRVYTRIRGDNVLSFTLSEINISSRSVLNFRFKRSSSPLRYTYQFLRAPSATLLTSHTELNQALIKAAKHDDPKAIRVLLERGADVDAKDSNDGTALHMAVSKGHVKTTKLLLSHAADINAKNEKDGATPLYLAACRGNDKTAKLLLSHGADVNLKTDDGSTPLHSAARRGNAEITDLLLTHGVEVNPKSHDGYTPLHLAARSGQVEAAKLLLSHGADINAKTVKLGATPLYFAASKGYDQTTKLLLSHGAHMKDGSQGRTPMQYTERYIQRQLKTMLLGYDDRLNNEPPVPGTCRACTEARSVDGLDMRI